MCGIVGFLARDAQLRESLGEFVVPMLTCMGERGPDSAGLAVFSDDLQPGLRRYSFYTGDRTFDWLAFLEEFAAGTGTTAEIDVVESHAVLVAAVTPKTVQNWLAGRDDPIHLLSAGRMIDVYKDEGHPDRHQG